LVRSIVEAHGGTVEATSDGLDQGSTFTVILPKVITESELISPSSLSVPLTGIPLEGLRILLVEDDEASMMVTSLALEQFGATVITADSAPKALEILPQQPLDIIITDVGLPDINGYEFMRQVRNLPPERGGQLPAIALTGYSDQQSINLALEAGFQAHISKPVDFMELVALVARIVQG
jgi:CheY-like chemotaxis protein